MKAKTISGLSGALIAATPVSACGGSGNPGAAAQFGSTGSTDSHVYTVTDSVGGTVAKYCAEGTTPAGLSPFPTLCVQTSKGEPVRAVYPTKALATVANFLRYLDYSFSVGTAVVDAIGAVTKATRSRLQNVPGPDLKISSVVRMP